MKYVRAATFLAYSTFFHVKVLKAAGVTDLAQYACVPANADNLMPDFFLDSSTEGPAVTQSEKKVDSEPLGEVGKLFKAIESTLSPDSVSKTQAVFAFVVTGDEAGKW